MTICKSCESEDHSNLLCHKCAPTKVPNSDKAETDSILGNRGDSVTVTCNTGWSGTRVTVCGADHQWSPVVDCTINMCAATKVANSDKATTASLTGMFRYIENYSID